MFREIVEILIEFLQQSQQVAAVLTAKGRIAAATYQITLAHAGYSIYFTNGDAPKTATSPWGIQAPI